jgi:hypothetical protein
MHVSTSGILLSSTQEIDGSFGILDAVRKWNCEMRSKFSVSVASLIVRPFAAFFLGRIRKRH